MQRWYDADQRNHGVVHAVAFGARVPTGIETAIGAHASDDDWDQRLANALATFRDCRWPADYLQPNLSPPGT